MIVICVEGCHGCGKTELSKQFQDAGFWVLDEAFLDMPEYALHPQSLLMETTWVCCWFERLLRRADECKRADVPHEQQVFIADRSPFSAVFYAQNGKGNLLEPIIREHVRELPRLVLRVREPRVLAPVGPFAVRERGLGLLHARQQRVVLPRLRFPPFLLG